MSALYSLSLYNNFYVIDAERWATIIILTYYRMHGGLTEGHHIYDLCAIILVNLQFISTTQQSRSRYALKKNTTLSWHKEWQHRMKSKILYKEECCICFANDETKAYVMH